MSKTWPKRDTGKAGVETGDTQSLRDENTLLFAQLHVVQQELERLHNQKADLPRGGIERLILDDSRFPDVAAEGLRSRKALEARDDVYLQQLRRSLANRLGMALIQGVSSPTALFCLPMKLWSIWRDTKEYAAPFSLGGKGYSKIIAAYKEGGTSTVDLLLRDKPASVKANAMTALARSLSNIDVEGSARYAREAFELDPRPFRLKWLAFREHDAGRAEESEALLAALPVGIKFSESEERQVGIVHADAERKRRRQILAQYDHIARRRELDNRFRQMTKELELQQASHEDFTRQLDEVKQACADLERERALLTSELEKHQVELASVSRSRESLQRAHTSLAREHADLVRLKTKRVKMRNGDRA